MLKKITLTLMCRMVSDTAVPEAEGAVRKLFQSRQEKMVVYTSGAVEEVVELMKSGYILEIL